MSHEVLSEVIQIRLRGSAARHPGSIVTAAARLRSARVLPLARRAGVGEHRARGDRRRHRPARRRLVGVAACPGCLRRSRLAVRAQLRSPTSRSRGRCRGGGGSRSSGPGSATIERLRVEGPRADAELDRRLAAVAAEAGGLADPARGGDDPGNLGRRRAGRARQASRSARASCSRPSSTSSAATAVYEAAVAAVG